MGVEIRFFMDSTDEQLLLEQLVCCFDVKLLQVVASDESCRRIMDIPGKLGSVRQYAMSMGTSISEFSTITYDEGHVRIDLGKSNVIDYKRSFLDGEKLRPGRFWYEKRGPTGLKPAEFTAWANRIFKYVRSVLTPVFEPIEAFAGKSALASIERRNVVPTSW